jgi:hypothetical protein
MALSHIDAVCCVGVVLSAPSCRLRPLPGVFLMRNSAWSRSFLSEWYGADSSPLVTHPHWEQAAFQALFISALATRDDRVPPVNSCELRVGTCAATGVTVAPSPTVVQLLTRVRLVPQKWLNSYPLVLANKIRNWDDAPAHAAYSPGDLIASFSGCVYILGAEACRTMHSDYFTIAER